MILNGQQESRWNLAPPISIWVTRSSKTEHFTKTKPLSTSLKIKFPAQSKCKVLIQLRTNRYLVAHGFRHKRLKESTQVNGMTELTPSDIWMGKGRHENKMLERNFHQKLYTLQEAVGDEGRNHQSMYLDTPTKNIVQHITKFPIPLIYKSSYRKCYMQEMCDLSDNIFTDKT